MAAEIVKDYQTRKMRSLYIKLIETYSFIKQMCHPLFSHFTLNQILMKYLIIEG
jgi:hypothetical protein